MEHLLLTTCLYWSGHNRCLRLKGRGTLFIKGHCLTVIILPSISTHLFSFSVNQDTKEKEGDPPKAI